MRRYVVVIMIIVVIVVVTLDFIELKKGKRIFAVVQWLFQTALNLAISSEAPGQSWQELRHTALVSLVMLYCIAMYPYITM